MGRCRKYLVGTPIYFDTAFTLDFITDEQLLRIIKNHGSEKILHATDSPWEKQGRMAKHLSALPLSEEDCNNIFYKNAKKLLKNRLSLKRIIRYNNSIWL